MAWIRCSGGKKTPTSYSIVSGGILQNNATISGNYQFEAGQIRIKPGNATITLDQPVTGYSRLVIVNRSAAAYTQLKVTTAGKTVTTPANTSLNTTYLNLNTNDVVGSISLELTPYSDVQFLSELWLEP